MTDSRAGRPAGAKDVVWTAEMAERFFDHLAATCNVSAAAAAIEICPTSVYNRRRSDAGFFDQWEGALACGYQMLETRLIAHALGGGAPAEMLPGGVAEPEIRAEEAVRLLALRRAGMAAKQERRGRVRYRATKAETNAVLLKKLAAIEARKNRS